MTLRAMILLLAAWSTLTVRQVGQKPPEQNTPHVYNVSLIQLIANPKDFNGQCVRITGYLGRNGIDRAVGVFVSEVDGRNFILSNSVDLHIEDSAVRSLTGKYVVLSGTYHSPSPRSGYNGSVDQIFDLKLWKAGDASK